MIGIVVFLSVLSALLLMVGTVLARVAWALYVYQREFEDQVEDRVNETLRTLDACYTDIAIVASRPVFYDSPEVRSVVTSIQRARDAVLHVARVFEDIIIEDNTAEVAIPDVPFVGSEPADVVERIDTSAGTADTVESATRARVLQDAAAGRVHVFTHDRDHMHAQGKLSSGVSTDKIRAALNRYSRT